ncbi:zf-HC2 domain-containing protein [Streptomyces himalayensis]|uniref:Zf-HC2 domain-containing protein n=1 Tax=Streptomyces himalayensis subsp. himalayensis TaxID=2756131 RepID=A0A7W0DL89_9ACTN|nr:zf-HC2 domain-containing protein [Streptomyces himalayensis subsp. himalayensis]
MVNGPDRFESYNGRIPAPRSSVEDGGQPLPDPSPPAPSAPTTASAPLVLEHRVLKSLLGAWALSACSPEEAEAVEAHLGTCGPCAEEALRLRDAVGLLHPAEPLDLDPMLRTRVLEGCLDRRPPRIPVPEWVAPYDAETARLDALLQDIGDSEWHAPVRLRWFDRDGLVSRKTTVAGVLAHLMMVDGLVALALGLDELPPMVEASGHTGGEASGGRPGPAERTEAYWRASHRPPTRAVRRPWRDQTHTLVRTVAFEAGSGPEAPAIALGSGSGSGSGSAEGSRGPGRLSVDYGNFELPLRDSMLDRAFECWVHAGDIADAVDYPYDPPAPRHLHHMFDLAARLLPKTLAARRRAGLASPPRRLVAAGSPGRTLRLEVEGAGGGEWLISLDSPGAVASAEHEVAHIALDGVEFSRLAAGHIAPHEAVAGLDGDREAIREVLFAAASLSRM